MLTKRSIKESPGDRMLLAVIYACLTIGMLVVLYPLIYILSASFSSPFAVVSGKVWLYPVDFTLIGYETVFKNAQVLVGYGNSLLYATIGTLVSLTVTIMMAYPLSRKTFYGRNVLMFILTFTMLFGGGLIPLYLVVKNLHLIDSRWSLILPQAIGVFQIIIARTFFQNTIPDELVDAAEMDGCSDVGFLIRVVLPLSKPIIAVMVLLFAVGQWNAYFDALLYIKSSELYPLQLVLRNILLLNTSENPTDISETLRRQGLAELMKYSLIVVSSLPVLILYPFVQKHFVQGVMIGSLKG
ncbi:MULTISPECIES: carbohydrate ABC transporter permease [unclassified Paenibacillus]|uniref:carbohydrate ABC transporter permease n=1 Tax=unclassified Paenibacillus TaxID=185978 RepID=UPI00278B2D13|nr:MULTISPECIES: carbohydrate ABC transporter permease [unclassified Paenibacillus]MDQ0900993.1 putative aldouronate transport system permease protein [Paenibacillus sp. V4I7]MDQ0920506.1 putative aldouronate transport system permease protein [Paenibacillus sp. V4I5]